MGPLHTSGNRQQALPGSARVPPGHRRAPSTPPRRQCGATTVHEEEEWEMAKWHVEVFENKQEIEQRCSLLHLNTLVPTLGYADPAPGPPGVTLQEGHEVANPRGSSRATSCCPIPSTQLSPTDPSPLLLLCACQTGAIKASAFSR